MSLNPSSVRIRNIKGRSAMNKNPPHLNMKAPAKTRPDQNEIAAELNALKLD